MNTIFKIWENILYEKLKNQINLKKTIHIAQFGSQQGKGATDAILAINLMQENNSSEALYTATIDLSKAYNRVDSPTVAQVGDPWGLAQTDITTKKHVQWIQGDIQDRS